MNFAYAQRRCDIAERGAGWLAFAAAALFWLVAALVSPAVAQDEQISLTGGSMNEPLLVAPGFTMTVQTDQPFAEVIVGNTEVADVFPLSSDTFYVQGNRLGATNVRFLGGSGEQLGVIVLRVQIDFAEIESAIARAIPSSRLEVTNINNRIRVSGTVRDAIDKARALEIARQFSDQPIVDGVRVVNPQQVQLDVRILEVSRNAGRLLGFNYNATGTDAGGDSISRGEISGVAGNAVPFGTFIGSLLSVAGTDIDVIIHTLEDKGVARRLANPTLVTSNGIEANFVVGGEVPINNAATDSNGNVATETDYREYGVRLNFRPVLLDEGLISLRIRPEVSDIDTSVSVNGQPAFISRKADTTVTLRDGQSFAIAGLLQTDNERNVKQVPWLGQIPILGTLFRSSAFQKQETDLVILVTPRLVHPASPDQPLVSPLDGRRSSNDVELFLLGMLEVDRDMIKQFEKGEGILGPYGHLIDLEFDDAVITKK